MNLWCACLISCLEFWMYFRSIMISFHRNDVDFFPGGCEKKTGVVWVDQNHPHYIILALGFLYSQMSQHLSKWNFAESFFVEGFPDFYAVPVFATALLSFCDSGFFNSFWRSLLLFWMDQICVSDKYICTSFNVPPAHYEQRNSNDLGLLSRSQY